MTKKELYDALENQEINTVIKLFNYDPEMVVNYMMTNRIIDNKLMSLLLKYPRIIEKNYWNGLIEIKNGN